MPFTAVMYSVKGREQSDCAIASLAMYLGYSYEDVLRVAANVDRPHRAKHGLFTDQIRVIAKELGTPLRYSRTIDWEEDYGILLLDEHAAVLRNGLIFDPDGLIWEFDDYLEHYKNEDWVKVDGILKAY
jgi:hypothetical protein